MSVQTAANAGTPDQALLELSRAAPHAFLTAAYRWLEEGGGSPTVVARMVDVLRDLGLAGPARELLGPRFGLAESGVDVAAVRSALRAAAQGSVTWESRRAVFERNLEALRASQPQLTIRSDEDLALPERCQLFVDGAGCHHLSVSTFGAVRRWPDGILAPRRPSIEEIQTLVPPQSIVVAGMALTGFVEALYAATRQATGPTSPILVVEPSWARIVAWLHTGDVAAMLEDPRVFVFAGPDAVADLGAALVAEPSMAIPRRILDAGTGVPLDVIAAEVTRASQRLRQEHAARLQRIAARDASRSARDVAARVVERGPVLALASRHTTMLQYAQRDISDALERLGFPTTLALEAERHHQMNEIVLAKLIEEVDPAFIQIVNHLRYESPRNYGTVPIVTWVQDPVRAVLCEEAGASIGDRDLICGYYLDRCVETFGYPEDAVCPVPYFPVSTARFHDGAIPADERDAYECDVMYVGNYHETPDELDARSHRDTPAHAHPLLDRLRCVVDAALRTGDFLVDNGIGLDDPKRLVRHHADDLGLRVSQEDADSIAYYYAYRLFDIGFRTQTLTWIARWARDRGRRFRLWGAGWERIREVDEFTEGPVEHGEPLRRAYRGARLTIQTIPSGFLHQRTMEASLSGSLVLTRYVPSDFSGLGIDAYHDLAAGEAPPEVGTPAIFPDFERTVFFDERGFADLADRMVEDAGAREALRSDFARIVRARFGYDAAVAHVVTRLEERLAAALRGAGDAR